MRKLILILMIALCVEGCGVAPPRVKSVEFGRSIGSESQRSAGVVFQDGGQSIAVNGGTLWLFGDTFVGRSLKGDEPDRKQITGARGTTIAFLPANQKSLPPKLRYFTDEAKLAANPLELFSNEPASRYRMWPAGGIGLDDRVYLFYSMIEKLEGVNPPWNFRSMGPGLAVGRHVLGKYGRLRPAGNWRFPVEPIQILRDGETLYLFEVSTEPRGLILARVPVNQIEDPSAYEFNAGIDQWSTDRSRAKVILREAYGQVSIVWSAALKRYLMATSSDFFHPKEIQIRSSERLEGPWSAPTRIAVPELAARKTTLVYCTYFHPELSDDDSLRFVVTFCRALSGEWELANPEWVTITLSR